MADIDEKEYSALNTRLDNMGTGAAAHASDTVNPLPSNITQTRYKNAKLALEAKWNAAKDAQTAANKAFDEYHTLYNSTETLMGGDTTLEKGIYGIHSETLRDYGIKPEKKRTGRKPKPTPPTA